MSVYFTSKYTKNRRCNKSEQLIPPELLIFKEATPVVSVSQVNVFIEDTVFISVLYFVKNGKPIKLA